MKLSDSQRERYSRMLALKDFSESNMKSIMNTTIAVVGAGGLGSPALRSLTAIGFGKIRIIDRDIVELSNIQRQTIYNTQDIGAPKVEAASTNLKMVNPNVEFDPLCVSIREDNALDLLSGADIILDGLDSFKARRAVNIASQELRIPYIFAGAVEYYANLSTFVPSKTGCLNCVMGNAEDNPDNTCAQVGVSPTLLSLAAAVEVNEAIRLATGREPLLGNRLMTIDSGFLTFDFFDIGKAEDCPVCSKSEQSVMVRTNDITVTQLCSQSYNISPPKKEKLNLKEIAQKLDQSYSVKSTHTSILVTLTTGEKVTLMTSGSAIVKGVDTADDAIRLYELILKKTI
ncbi:MAG: HesA/MoeB/ThiF family protein [Candidatus Thorarchaeota archaeon]|nr:MAG: HesA/MoeB/ThiF family protein [Candidatus Thorarchaeota archaeon]